MKAEKPSIQKRDDMEFTFQTGTRIWQEQASENNPYLAERCRCHGYDLIDLMRNCSYVDMLFLLIKGELPSFEERRLLESVMVAFINPGPRHPATRAAMNVSISRTYTHHILPIALSIMGGSFLGGEEVVRSMRFFLDNMPRDPEKVARELLKTEKAPREGDWHIVPGFGTRFGGIDPIPQTVAVLCEKMPASDKTLKWGMLFAKVLNSKGMGWLSTGVAAAVFNDLGFNPWLCAGLFQLISAPGLLAHGMELAKEPITKMPFLDKEHYIIAEEAKSRQGTTL